MCFYSPAVFYRKEVFLKLNIHPHVSHYRTWRLTPPERPALLEGVLYFLMPRPPSEASLRLRHSLAEPSEIRWENLAIGHNKTSALAEPGATEARLCSLVAVHAYAGLAAQLSAYAECSLRCLFCGSPDPELAASSLTTSRAEIQSSPPLL